MPGKIDLRKSLTLAPIVLLDTSILLAALLPGLRGHVDAKNFLTYAAAESANRRTIIVTTEMAVQECAHYVTKAGLIEDVKQRRYPKAEQAYYRQQGSRGSSQTVFDWQKLYKHHPVAIQRHVSQVEQFLRDVRAIPVRILEPKVIGATATDISDRMTKYMYDFFLQPADAYQLAIASALAITMVASPDGDWLRAARNCLKRVKSVPIAAA